MTQLVPFSPGTRSRTRGKRKKNQNWSLPFLTVSFRKGLVAEETQGVGLATALDAGWVDFSPPQWLHGIDNSVSLA